MTCSMGDFDTTTTSSKGGTNGCMVHVDVCYGKATQDQDLFKEENTSHGMRGVEHATKMEIETKKGAL